MLGVEIEFVAVAIVTKPECLRADSYLLVRRHEQWCRYVELELGTRFCGPNEAFCFAEAYSILATCDAAHNDGESVPGFQVTISLRNLQEGRAGPFITLRLLEWQITLPAERQPVPIVVSEICEARVAGINFEKRIRFRSTHEDISFKINEGLDF